jgi:hypothetical protein
MQPRRRTELIGAPRPQTPRRSPRQAFEGNKALPRQRGNKPQSQTTTNHWQNYSFEVSRFWGQTMGST